MTYPNHPTNFRKHKHLTYQERVIIQIRLQDGYSPYKIAKELGYASNTVRNEIACGTVSQIKQGKIITQYLADAGEAIYKRNRKNCCPKFKRIKCKPFIEYVCTKTLYNYIDLQLLDILVTDLPMKLRRHTKAKSVRTNRRRLGTSIEKRPDNILTREEFGHWEIDTVIGTKDKSDSVLLTLAERQTRHFIVRKIAAKTASAVQNELAYIKTYFGEKFNEVFKSITSDNGQEFAGLHKLEQDSDVKIYFTYPYTPYERGTNERHNGLIRRFLPKGNVINGYTTDDIAFIEDWCNTLPRKILNYRIPEEAFEEQLDLIYASE